MPRIPVVGSLPQDQGAMPDEISYDEPKKRLHIGKGFIDNVEPSVWRYEVSGKQVLRQWFSYRRKSRERPTIGDRTPSSPLGRIQPDRWLTEYTTELINVLNVLGRLVELEAQQAELLDKICAGPMIGDTELHAAGALERPLAVKRKKSPEGTLGLFDSLPPPITRKRAVKAARARSRRR
jgi:hypothetical protein